MKKENKNVVVVSCPPCGENVALATKRGAYKAFSLMSPSIGPADHFLRKGGRLAFTLIELLVVVLIIGILAAVAVPQYQKTIERSKATEALSMLSSIAKAYQTHYLANGQYAEKFDELDVDIPFTGTTKFYALAKDTKSNKDWSFQIENNSNYVNLYAARIDGKYKGSGFFVPIYNSSNPPLQRIVCFERKSAANILFDTNLPEGAYCERVLQAVKTGGDEWARYYRLP